MDTFTEAALRSTDRWEPFLEGITDVSQRVMLSRLMDNQKAALEGATNTADILPFTRFAFPLIRRVYPNLFANKLVSVQPISMPTAKVFTLDFHYDSNVAPVARGDRMDYQFNQGANILKAQSYTRGQARGAVLGTGDGTQTEFVIPTPYDSPHLQTTFTPIQDNDNLAVYLNSTKQATSAFDVDFVRGIITFASAPSNGAAVTADFDLRLEGDDSRIPEIGLSMTEALVTAVTRKLKFRWTLEAQQDMQAYHGLSVEAELMTQAAREIQLEIDRTIITDLEAGATTNANWAKAYPGNTTGFPSKRDYEETLIHAILDVETAIYKKRLVKPNWIVTSPDVAARLEKLNAFHYAGDVKGGNVQRGIHHFGSLRNRWNIYVDPMFTNDKMLLGYKGDGQWDAGYVHAPYVPLMVTPTQMDANDFTPVRAMMRRDASVLVSGDMFGTVTLQ